MKHFLASQKEREGRRESQKRRQTDRERERMRERGGRGGGRQAGRTTGWLDRWTDLKPQDKFVWYLCVEPAAPERHHGQSMHQCPLMD